MRGVLRIATWANRQWIAYLAELAQLFICENPAAPVSGRCCESIVRCGSVLPRRESCDLPGGMLLCLSYGRLLPGGVDWMRDDRYDPQILIWFLAALLAFIVSVGIATALALPSQTRLMVGVALFSTTFFSSVAALDRLFAKRL